MSEIQQQFNNQQNKEKYTFMDFTWYAVRLTNVRIPQQLTQQWIFIWNISLSTNIYKITISGLNTKIWANGQESKKV